MKEAAGTKITANWYEGEWTDEGALVTVSGFVGVKLSCPRCGVELPRGEHRCGDKVSPVKKVRRSAVPKEAAAGA